MKYMGSRAFDAAQCRCFALLSALMLCATGGSTLAQTACVERLKQEAAQADIGNATIRAAFDSLELDPKVLDLESYQPEFKTPVWDYTAALVDDERVKDGRKALGENEATFSLAERRFGVSRYIIAAIWGIESNYGEEMGSRPLVQSLASLACLSKRRPQYFAGELFNALKIADRGDIPLSDLKGSWAGAFGQTQFMPSSFLRLAVDLDGSGRNVIGNKAAALGSTANFLHKSGWSSGLSWGYEVKLPSDYSGPLSRKDFRPAAFWREHGVSRLDGESLPAVGMALLAPAGRSGPAFLVTHNFNAIFSYNASEAYALAAGVLAQRLAGGRGIETPWPTDDVGLSRAERRELQQLLSSQGYNVGAADGAIGDKTRAAIADFQRKVGMDVNGRASKRTLEALRK